MRLLSQPHALVQEITAGDHLPKMEEWDVSDVLSSIRSRRTVVLTKKVNSNAQTHAMRCTTQFCIWTRVPHGKTATGEEQMLNDEEWIAHKNKMSKEGKCPH